MAGAGLSGCSVPGTGGSNVSNWLPEPDETGDINHYSTIAFSPSELAANEDELSEEFFDQLESTEDTYDPTGIKFEDVDTTLYVRQNNVLLGGFSQSDVTAELEDNDFEQDDELNGYQLYVPDSNDSSTPCYAVGDAVIRATPGYNSDMDSVETAELLIETNSGNVDRYIDDSDAMNNLASQVGTPSIGSMQTSDPTEEDNPENGAFENAVGNGVSLNLNGDTTDLQLLIQYESADDVDTGDLEDWVDETDGSDQLFGDVDGVSTNANGSAGVINGTIDTDDVDSQFLI